ncbi:MAG: hypothetical protein RSB25_17010, partial [Acinetobacter sp.]
SKKLLFYSWTFSLSTPSRNKRILGRDIPEFIEGYLEFVNPTKSEQCSGCCRASAVACPFLIELR